MAPKRSWVEELLLEEEFRRLTAFDEGTFPPLDEQQYLSKIEHGCRKLAELRIAIGLLARNVEPVLWMTIARIEELRKYARESSIFIVENDSQDNTKRILDIWSKADPTVHVDCYSFRDPVWDGSRNAQRAKRMAYYRQLLKNAIVEHGPFDAVAIFDSDLPGGWSCEGWLQLWHDWPLWDMVSCQGLVRRDDGKPGLWYRDAWAYREADWKDRPNIIANEKVYPRAAPRVKVLSAFGSAAVYRYEAFITGNYGIDPDCEHVTFHRTLHHNGFSSLWVDPSFIGLYSDMWGHFQWWKKRYQEQTQRRLLAA